MLTNQLKKFTGAACVLVACALAAGAIPPDPMNNNAWSIGEKLTYQVKYGFFRAGTSVFAVEGEETVGGKRALRISSTIQSAPGFFYKINDVARSISEATSLYTIRYEKIQRSQNETSTNITTFNHAARTGQRVEDGVPCTPITIKPYTIDVLGAIYYVRTLDLQVGRVYKFPVHDGMRDYGMEVTVRKIESITVPAGTFSCLLVEPRLREANGQIRKKGQMTLWMTNDSRHIPMQIKMSLPVGSMTAQLQVASGTRAVVAP